jgi:malonate transporter and related proteins
MRTFAIIGTAIAPVSLFSVGMDIDFKVFKESLATISAVTLLKLVIMPAIAIGVALAMKLPPLLSVALLVTTAVPTAKSVFVLTKVNGVYEKEGAAAVVGTTAISIVTITLFIMLADHLWPSAFSHIHHVLLASPSA